LCLAFRDEESMPKLQLLAVCCVALLAVSAVRTSAQEKQALKLVRTISLPGATGRLDHMGVDLEKKRLFVAAVTNNTLEVVDLTGGKVIKSLTGMKDTQDALFLGVNRPAAWPRSVLNRLAVTLTMRWLL
jgi:hypothetical protein